MYTIVVLPMSKHVFECNKIDVNNFLLAIHIGDKVKGVLRSLMKVFDLFLIYVFKINFLAYTFLKVHTSLLINEFE